MRGYGCNPPPHIHLFLLEGSLFSAIMKQIIVVIAGNIPSKKWKLWIVMFRWIDF